MNSKGRGRGPKSGASRRLILVAAPAFLWGCQLVGRGTPAPPEPSPVPVARDSAAAVVADPEVTSEQPWLVVYQGALSLDGGALPAGLEIEREAGGEIRATLQTSSDLVASGTGRLRGAVLSLNLAYGGDCPGRLLLEGDWDAVARVYAGELEAMDCTGTARGTFRFTGTETFAP